MKRRSKNICVRPHPPFLCGTKRFSYLGLHPQLDKSGFFKKKITEAAPGTYEAKFTPCSYKQGFSWSRKVAIEEFSKYRGYSNPTKFQLDEFKKTLGGPAVHEVNEKLFKQQHDSKKTDVGLGTAKRFTNSSPNVPPPNTYYRKLDELDTLLRKDICNTKLFEADGFIDRFRSLDPNYRLPPNIYNFMNFDGKNTADIVKKKVSIKGPYNLFTGPRDGSTIKNYFAPSSFKPPENFYVKPSDLDNMLHHPSQINSGTFLKGKRFPRKPTIRHILDDLSLCYRNSTEPGPAYYRVEQYNTITKKSESLFPFEKCNPQARPPPAKWTIFPGPGRYSPKYSKCMKQKRPSWVFLSKYTRKICDPPVYTVYH